MDKIYEAYTETLKSNQRLDEVSWGSSDQTAMNDTIHKAIGKPKQFVSPFNKDLRAAAKEAVSFYWDDWSEYKRGKYSELEDKAVMAYLKAYFPKEMAGFAKMFGAR